MSKKIHIGTSGWSYEHWGSNVFYPKEIKAKDQLKYYSEHFDSVEINNTFYHLPSSKTILNWKKIPPDDFLFCPKLSRLITHQKMLHQVDDLFKGFLDRFKPLKKRMGPILIQFPPRLRFQNPNVPAFLDLVGSFWSWNFAIEARHESWMTEEVKNLLLEKKIAWVIADSGGNYPSMEAVTSSIVYLRFHGPGRQYASKYTKNALLQYAEKIKKWLSENREIWVFFNNDDKGYAVENALTFQKLMK